MTWRNTSQDDVARMLAENKDLSSASITPAPSEAEKVNKYHVASKEKRTYKGILFASRKEMLWYRDWDLHHHTDEICLRQVPFALPGGTTYRLDFMLLFPRDTVPLSWLIRYVEVKGKRLPMGELKMRQVEELYGIHIEVV